MEEKWIKFKSNVEYHNCLPPHAELVAPRMVEYYKSKHPELGDAKIPVALDVACGTGLLTEPLANYCEKVIATDVSPTQIELALQLTTHKNIEYKILSVYESSQLFGNKQEKADLIVTANASHYFNNKQYYDEIRKCLKYGGVLAESAFTILSFPEIPTEAFDKHFEFWNQISTNYRKNEDYTKMFEVFTSAYEKMKSHLEECEWLHFSYDLRWTLKDICDFLLFSTTKIEDYTETVYNFYSKLWKDYNVGEKLLLRVRIGTIYSRNMKRDE